MIKAVHVYLTRNVRLHLSDNMVMVIEFINHLLTALNDENSLKFLSDIPSASIIKVLNELCFTVLSGEIELLLLLRNDRILVSGITTSSLSIFQRI